MLLLRCTTLTKKNSQTNLSTKIVEKVFADNEVPEGVNNLIQGGREVGEWMSKDTRIPLVSATGSTRMGKELNKEVAGRLGKTILELGGNNAIIITEHADLDMSLIGAVFGAVGTAGQRCTSTRRLIIHEKIYDQFVEKLVKAYQQIKIGDPLDSNNHMGPLIDKDAVKMYLPFPIPSSDATSIKLVNCVSALFRVMAGPTFGEMKPATVPAPVSPSAWPRPSWSPPGSPSGTPTFLARMPISTH